MRSTFRPYVCAVLHAHQVAVAIFGERGAAVMVSRSADGDLLLVSLAVLGIKAIRGSNTAQEGSKGGRDAIAEMVKHVSSGSPCYLAVDGPRGPRNQVRKGVAVLSQRTGAPVVVMAAIPSQRWIIQRAWDRFQIPKPFCRIDAYFGEPLHPEKDEKVEDFRRRIDSALNDLERKRDPNEHAPA